MRRDFINTLYFIKSHFLPKTQCVLILSLKTKFTVALMSRCRNINITIEKSVFENLRNSYFYFKFAHFWNVWLGTNLAGIQIISRTNRATDMKMRPNC